MHRTGVLLAALALLVCGCGGQAAPSTSATTPATASATASATRSAGAAGHGDQSAQRAVLTKAVTAFRAAGSGGYESEVTADGVDQPLAHESGSYRLSPVAAQFERAILGIDPTSRKPLVQVVRVRSVADQKSFLQIKAWGTWTGCWLKTDLSAITRLTGVAIDKAEPLPTAIAVLAHAKVVGAGGGLDGPHLAVDAYTALQFLGISRSAIDSGRDAFARVEVPVLLDVTSAGGPSGAAVEGSQVLTALETAGTPVASSLRTLVSKTHAKVVLSDLGTPVQVTSPDASVLLPRHPAPSSTCPANR